NIGEYNIAVKQCVAKSLHFGYTVSVLRIDDACLLSLVFSLSLAAISSARAHTTVLLFFAGLLQRSRKDLVLIVHDYSSCEKGLLLWNFPIDLVQYILYAILQSR